MSRFHKWTRGRGYPDEALRRISPAFLKAIQLMESAEDRRQIVTRSLSGTESTDVNICAADFCIYKSKSNGLLRLSVISPDWRLGRLSRDEDVDSILGGLLNFSAQYTYRARAINILFSLRTEFEVSSEFRYLNYESRRCSTAEAHNLMKAARIEDSALTKITANQSTRNLIINYRQLNTLDSHIFSAIFYFLRAYDLENGGFSEEAVNSLDNVISICGQFLLNRRLTSRNLSHKDIALTMGFDHGFSEEVERAYLLRSHFGAHPTYSKWHDFSDIYGDDLHEIFDNTRLVILRLCDLERSHRLVEQFPDNWAEWYKSQAEMLYDAVWFEKIPD